MARGTGWNYTGDYSEYTWYRLQCVTGRYTEYGWIAQHPKHGFIWADALDREED